MSANVNERDVVRQVDRRPEPDEQVTEKQVQSPAELTRLLMRMLSNITALMRRWAPQRIDFEKRAVDDTGTTKYRFAHGFGPSIRWWPVGWADATSGNKLVEDPDSDDNTLVLVSYEAGTLTLRIEEGGG